MRATSTAPIPLPGGEPATVARERDDHVHGIGIAGRVSQIGRRHPRRRRRVGVVDADQLKSRVLDALERAQQLERIDAEGGRAVIGVRRRDHAQHFARCGPRAGRSTRSGARGAPDRLIA